ncbi:membrane protein insertase YidC [Schaalia sp. 19OD2882]|uniref:membrane protein insertase YidC n=1 Tax=Schaalia sp. 19OD2882 TaxID=2794089 RepID=UPI001C1EE95B|nr:membrane protein insertase YidC [Schaalia sp. 19OD2882]QWW19572.1 membrane protein insertase YidC [Schaalia sp. 19OD2882]
MWEQILHPFAVAIAWVWVWIHNALVFVGLGSGAGFAWILSIILVTIVVRAAILPLFYKQIKSSRGMQALQPELKKLQEKYKGKTDAASKQKMGEEQMALFKKHGTSPFASCLPLLVQMPILFAMYRAIFAASDLAKGTFTYQGVAADSLGPITQTVAKEIVDSTVFGVPTSHMFSDTPDIAGKAVFIIMIAAMVIMQFFSMRLSMTKNMPAQADPNNPMAQSTKMMMYVMPVMFIGTGFFFQMGLLVYMVTTTVWSLGQSLWTIMYMPTPGSEAHSELVAKRQSKYQEWARPFFAEYDRARAGIARSDSEALADLDTRTLTDVRTRAKAQRINSNFPETMSEGEILGVYRNLAGQEWDTLPDEQWMRAIHRAAERTQDRREQSASREQRRKLSREQRRVEAERQAAAGGAGSPREAKDAPGETSGGAGDNGQESSAAGASGLSEQEQRRAARRDALSTELTPEEIERRRQQRKKDMRGRRKRKR